MQNKKTHNTSISFIRRQYMELPNYEIFYYNDINIDTIEQHYHPNYELYFFLEGNVEYKIMDNTYHLQQGDFLIIPPETVHGPQEIDRNKPYCRFVLWVSEEFINFLNSFIDDLEFGIKFSIDNDIYKYHLDYVSYNDIFGNFLDLWQEYNENNMFKNTTIINCIITILLKINRIIYENSNMSSKTPKKELYTLVFEYINRNITSDLTLESIANHFFVSKYHVAHIFKDNLGISLHQYVIKKRLNSCRRAIASGEPITSVAEKFGFADYTSFFRAFKKEYGISPKDYQKNMFLNNKL